MREDVIQRGLVKARKIFDKMNASRDMEYLTDTVRINNRLTLKFECQRNEADYCRGRACCFEIYAVKDGEEVDCCTLHLKDVNEEIIYLLNCYV